MYAIETEQLRRAFGDHVAVEGLSLAIPTGSVFAFLGPNGAGKTTTVRMLAGLIQPSGGSARVAGHDVVRAARSVRQRVGTLTESPGLYERLSAIDNLSFFGQLAGLSAREASGRAEGYLRALDLWERRDTLVGGFSKGMRQKLAIVRALLHEPEVLFLDEPTSGLDPVASRRILDFIAQLRAEGRTIFLTTHNLTEADELADLVGIFKGHLLRLGTPAALRAGVFGCGTEIRVAGPAQIWGQLVKSLPFVRGVVADAETLLVMLDDPEAQNPALVRALVTNGAEVRAVASVRHSLESVYRELIGATAPAAKEPV